MNDRLRTDALSLMPDLSRWRRDFHRHPEIGGCEERTSAVIRRFLEDISIPVVPCAGTGLVARLEGLPGGPTVALRADMDALPLQEVEGREYGSQNPGVCHACGHDGHMAIQMGVAALLARRKGEFQGNVVLLFQPSEEVLPGGAGQMISEGALRGVDGIFGLHLWQSMATGTVACLPGPMMASTAEFSITVTGKGGHGSMPHTAVDPILAASQLVVSLQSIASRNVDPLKAFVLTVGQIQGGSATNIIPSSVTLRGTVRTFDDAIQNLVEERMRAMVEGTCRAFGAVGSLEFVRGYPAVINDPDLSTFVRQVAAAVLGSGCVFETDPVMGGEDFSRYQLQVPGAFLFFGMGDGTAAPHHHAAFDLDEAALPQAVLLMSSLALEYLRRNPLHPAS